MRKNWQYIKQNYIAEIDRIVGETDRLTIIKGNFNIAFSETDGTEKISKNISSWIHMIELHN